MHNADEQQPKRKKQWSQTIYGDFVKDFFH